MPDRFYIVDAMAFAFRMYYAIRARLTDPHGRPTNAVYGFTRALLKILREHKPTHLAVVFDAPGKTFRDELYEHYKATRPEPPEELKVQIPLLYEVVRALHLPLFVVPGVEADDVIGTLAKEAAGRGFEVVLVTSDKDFLQLVDDAITVFDPSKGDEGAWYRRPEVIERFGVGPEHVTDALALIGDTADNVPGVRGIGEKTAKKLLEKYGSLETLYEHIDEIGGKIKENLLADKEQAFFSRRLLTIRTDVPLPFGLDACHVGSLETGTALALFSDLGFSSLVSELAPSPSGDLAASTAVVVSSREQLEAVVQSVGRVGNCAVSAWWTGANPVQGELLGLAVVCKEGEAYYVPLAPSTEEMLALNESEDTSEQLSEKTEQAMTAAADSSPEETALSWDDAEPLLGRILTDPAIKKVGHDLKTEYILFARRGIPLRGMDMDTMLASYLTDPSRMRHNIDEVSLHYLQRKPASISDRVSKRSQEKSVRRLSLREVAAVVCERAEISRQLANIFHPILVERDALALLQEIELPLVEVLAHMEMTGVAIDRRAFEELQVELRVRLAALEAEITKAVGMPFNLRSPKQLQHVLFSHLGLQPSRKTKTGSSTDSDVLEELRDAHPVIEKIIEHRTLEKLRSAYVEALPQLIDARTGRLHTSFNQAVAATGRLSSTNPNLQNIPIRTEWGQRIRAGFVAGGEDRVLLSADYSQVELRILAHLSRDEALLQAFAEDTDIHTETAARLFGVPREQVTPDMRRQAKTINFGVIYGMSAYGLAKTLGMAVGEAANFIEAYFRQYPGVRQWIDQTLEEARDRGYVKTLLNRRRYVPELRSDQQTVRRAAERVAINTPVQGSAADLIKCAMLRVWERIRESRAYLVLQVHDELLFEVPRDEVQKWADQVRACMSHALPLDVPLKVDVGWGRHWAEAHP